MNAQTNGKPVLFSGVQPSGNLTIGNYIGAISTWAEMQDEYDCIFALVDLHTITGKQDPSELRRRCYDFLALYMACGIDPASSTIVLQSHVPAHAELAWVLGCFVGMGELSRMSQFKERSRRSRSGAGAGLFSYPVLMAADILLYGTELVPVGDDQKQHVEFTRNLAGRFNRIYGDTFKVPEIYTPPVGARIMSLQSPRRKMDKSDRNPRNYIALLDPPDTVRSKVRRAVTDAGTRVVYGKSHPAISNLITIYVSLTGEPFDAVVQRYNGRGYTRFKEDLAEVIVEVLRPIQDRYSEIREAKSEMDRILKKGARAARVRSRLTMNEVYRKVGFITLPA